MKHLLLSLLILALTRTYAQETQLTFFLKDGGKEVISKEEADFVRIVKSSANNSGRFEFFEYYKNDTLKREGYCSNYDPFLKLEGSIKEYDNKGVKRSEQTYIDNQLTGQAKFYYSNGRLKKTIEYLKIEKAEMEENRYLSPPSKLIVFYDSLGVQTVNDGNGIVEEEEYGDTHKGNYRNGYKDSIWIGYNKKENFSYEEVYADGRFLSGTSVKSGKTNKYSAVEELPSFKGGMSEFYQFVGQNFRYPKSAKEFGISGRVILSFVVDKTGRINDIKILKDPGSGTGEEAVRVLKKSPRWYSGKVRGIPVRVSYTLPIMLSLGQG